MIPCIAGPGSRLYVAEDDGLLDLSAPPELTLFRSQVTDGIDRLANWFFPGDDVGGVSGYSYARANSTAYVAGEHTYDGENGFRCLTGGTSGGSSPSWNTTAIRAKSANTGGSQTTDGTVVWEYIVNSTADFGTGGFNGTNHRSDRISNTNGAPIGYYDFGYTVWQSIDYLDRIGSLTTAQRQKLETYASYWIANYVDLRNSDYTEGAGYWVFSDGLYEDFARTASRYKYSPVVTAANLATLAAGSAFSSVSTHWTDTADTFWLGDNNMIRELAYMILSHLNSIRAGNSARTVDLGGGEGAQSVFRYFIPYAMNHFSQYMNGISSGEPVGIFSPFMSGLMSHSLARWYDYEVSQGRDPNRYCNHGNFGTINPAFNFRTNATHGICQAWPTLTDMLEDFWYWAANTALNDDDDPMYDPVEQAYLYRNDDFAEGPQPDLNNLISHAPAWVANYRVQNGGSITAWTPAQFMQHADDLFEAGVTRGSYDLTQATRPYFLGKQYNEAQKLAFHYLTARNAASGRND